MSSQNSMNSNNNSTGYSSMSGFGMGTMQSSQPSSTTLPQKQPTPDLSAFDSLLPSTNKNNKGLSMNAMAQNKVLKTLITLSEYFIAINFMPKLHLINRFFLYRDLV